MIKLIEIDKLHPHPDNPRKDLGDLTELADSIKRSGILQNLTVVPATGYHHGDYTVIIGHRRCAAARLAGLAEVPCVVCEMDQKEQIATMLLENMQRSDLTVYEQAQGFQMMLDLGESIEDVSGKTGFSESTIRRRVKLLQLDSENFKASEARQVSLIEYEKLFEIENPEKRNELLTEIGTANFNDKLLSAKRTEEQQKKNDEILSKLREFAIEKKGPEGLRYVTCIYNLTGIPKDLENVKYYYEVTSWGSIYLYREYTDEEKSEQENRLKQREKEDKERKKLDRKRQQLDEMKERFYQLRYNFIKGFNASKEKAILCEFAAWSMFQWDELDEGFEEITGVKFFDEEDELDNKKVIEYLGGNCWNALLYAAYLRVDGKGMGCHTWRCEYSKDEELEIIYDFLTRFGYEMSDDEKAYMDGTHELFERE